MKQIQNRFKHMKIGQKLFLCSAGVIIIMTLLVGVCGYSISRQILLSKTEEQSAKLMAELVDNYNYAIRNLEDLVTSQTFNEKFSALLREDSSNLSAKLRYDLKIEIENYENNLIYYNKYITSVIIGDSFGNLYYSSRQKSSLASFIQEELLNYDAVLENWGVTIWEPYSEEEVFATKLLFDYSGMKPIGAIAIGVSADYFQEMYQDLVGGEISIAILNKDQEVLLSSDENSQKLSEIILKKYPDMTEHSGEIFFQSKKYLCSVQKTADSKIQIMSFLSESSISAEIFQKLMIPLLLLALAAITLSTFLSLLISRPISSDIRLLLENIRHISKGDFSQRITPQSQDEIGMLAEQFNDMAIQIQSLIQTVTNEKMQKKNSELKALQFEYDSLQAKINPHFLYNTLESISSQAKINGQDKISDSIYLLGNYLRESISDRRKFVTLEEELKNSRQYIEIQKLSYGNKIHVIFEIDEALNEVMVPKLILQPLVENAIIHGIEPKLEPGTVRILSVCDKKDMIIKVIDNGVGITKERIDKILDENEFTDIRHTKVGLQAVHKRLQILYGTNYGVTIEGSENEGTCISLRLPIEL